MAACDGEWGDVVAAGIAVVGACMTVETGVGVALCAGAYWAYLRAVEKLDECRRANGLAALDQQVQSMYAEAQYLTQLAESAGQQVQTA
jgi:hypothetical protein